MIQHTDRCNTEATERIDKIVFFSLISSFAPWTIRPLARSPPDRFASAVGRHLNMDVGDHKTNDPDDDVHDD